MRSVERADSNILVLELFRLVDPTVGIDPNSEALNGGSELNDLQRPMTVFYVQFDRTFS